MNNVEVISPESNKTSNEQLAIFGKEKSGSNSTNIDITLSLYQC